MSFVGLIENDLDGDSFIRTVEYETLVVRPHIEHEMDGIRSRHIAQLIEE